MFFILYLVPFCCLSSYSSYYPCTFYSKLYVLPVYLVTNVHCIPAYLCHPSTSLPNDVLAYHLVPIVMSSHNKEYMVVLIVG